LSWPGDIGSQGGGVPLDLRGKVPTLQHVRSGTFKPTSGLMVVDRQPSFDHG
jgi:hypothetical protein